MTRRLTENDKAKLLELFTSNDPLIKLTDRFIDSNDGSEFHEGMAAGLLLAVEIIISAGGKTTLAGSQAINACIQRCINETKTK